MARASALITFEKGVSESRLFNFNFSPKMVDDATIVSIVSLTGVATTSGPAALSLGTPIISGKKIQVRISGGTNNAKYLMVARGVTNLDNTIQVSGYLLVRDPA